VQPNLVSAATMEVGVMEEQTLQLELKHAWAHIPHHVHVGKRAGSSNIPNQLLFLVKKEKKK
jgi:hypothetical protein